MNVPFEGLRLGDWVWCLHCEKVYQYGEYREEKVAKRWRHLVGAIIQMCPTDECSGGQGDMWTWARVREVNPGYPEIPMRGVLYPLYGE